MDALFQDSQVIGEPARDRFKTKVDELFEDVFEWQAPGTRGRGARNRKQAREVDGKIVLQRSVFEQIGHGQVGLGVFLQLQHDVDVGRGFVADVDQLRHFFGGDEFADAFDDGGLVHGKGDRVHDDLRFAV